MLESDPGRSHELNLIMSQSIALDIKLRMALSTLNEIAKRSQDTWAQAYAAEGVIQIQRSNLVNDERELHGV